jgi:hypothetical protein
MQRAPHAGPVILPLALALGLAWGGWAAGVEVGKALAGYDGRAQALAGVIGWREGMPQVVRFRRFAEAARPLLPAGSRVVFTSPDDGAGQQFFRRCWAAYLLPEVDVLPLSDPAAQDLGQFLLAYGERIDHPRLELVRRLPGGWLHRVRPDVPAP